MSKNRRFKNREKKRKLRKYQNKLKEYNNKKGKLKRIKKHKEKIERALKYVEIFTQENLTDTEITVLGKGLKYIPTPRKTNIRQILLQDFEELSRKMRCKYHFSDKSSSDIEHPFRQKSGYQPGIANNAIENYLFATKIELSKIECIKCFNNTNKNERMAIQKLRSNERIVIKKADKNTSSVIMDKAIYLKQAMSLLNNNTQYEKNTNKSYKRNFRIYR